MVMTYRKHVSLGMRVGTSFNPFLEQSTYVPLHGFAGSHSQGTGQAPVFISESTVLSKTVQRINVVP